MQSLGLDASIVQSMNAFIKCDALEPPGPDVCFGDDTIQWFLLMHNAQRLWRLQWTMLLPVLCHKIYTIDKPNIVNSGPWERIFKMNPSMVKICHQVQIKSQCILQWKKLNHLPPPILHLFFSLWAKTCYLSHF